MEDANDGSSPRFGLLDQFDYHPPVSGIKRGSGLIEKENWIMDHKAASNVDPLLLATRKGRGSERP
ncbi:hypothetical protein GCM10007857_69830 [Bradyrhizobium iriomotense]|uniref:Uncharacterized protein n=1 Tax=Bradyrhizobium iriomotense TaxID=441950 RepID=A0ABQ6B779_9BRAD|nr:hypothetical protein GCM10007857_69830 [Bradyrhizobium iriomotense]